MTVDQLSSWMGVHPGCPVCLIVAASLLAVETDVGETISAAKVALILCVVSGLLELLRSFLWALLPTSAFTSFFSLPVCIQTRTVSQHLTHACLYTGQDCITAPHTYLSVYRLELYHRTSHTPVCIQTRTVSQHLTHTCLYTD